MVCVWDGILEITADKDESKLMRGKSLKAYLWADGTEESYEKRKFSSVWRRLFIINSHILFARGPELKENKIISLAKWVISLFFLQISSHWMISSFFHNQNKNSRSCNVSILTGIYCVRTGGEQKIGTKGKWKWRRKGRNKEERMAPVQRIKKMYFVIESV